MEGNKPPLADDKQKIEEVSSFNLKWFVSTVLAIWPWLLASVVVSLIIANLYLRYITPMYRSFAELLIIDSKKGSTTSGDDIMKMLNINSKNINLENEIEVLKSNATMERVVTKLHLNIGYFVVGRFKTTNVYNNKPFELIIADSTDDNYYCKIDNIENNGYRFTERRGNVINGKWDDTITVSEGRKFVLKKTPFFSPSNLLYTVNIGKVNKIARSFNVDISANTKSASYVTIALTDAIPERSIDIINELMRVYMNNNVETRNRISDSTIKFIDARIVSVLTELSSVEDSILVFKQHYDIADMSAQAVQLVNANADTREKYNDAQVEYGVIESISNYLQNAKDDKSIILPASLMGNSGLAALMDKFNTIITEIETSEISNTPENPVTKTLYEEKQALKQKIISSLASSREELKLKVEKIKEELDIINGDIQKIPLAEKIYLEKARLQSIKQDMYIFLLKKREETAITKASTVADADIIDAAVMAGQVSPNHPRILMISLLIGIIIPFGIIVLRKALNIKIISKGDILKMSSIPIIGEIGNNEDRDSIAVKRNSRTIISEQFRALRTNLQYLLTDKKDKVLMITSSMSGEGKSFIAVNLSITLAMSGKKVVLMELDLRKPKISKTLNIDNNIGFSNYAIGKCELKDIIKPSGIEPNLFILPSGPVPPNPAELILLPRSEELFQLLREQFDYIIVDTSPVGLVTDAQLINRYADTTLYIIRQGHTYKQQLNIPNELYYSGKITRLSFIVNDVIANRGFAYGYGYEEGYGYGYGYGSGYGYSYGYGSYGSGYYTEGTKKGIRKWFRSRKK